MKDKSLKDSVKKINKLGFGACQLSNHHDFIGLDDISGVNLVREAIKNGINFFDTAPNYGLGTSERVIGEGIKGKRDDVYINTKFGHHVDDTRDFDALKIKKSIEGSLVRLQTNYLDSVLLHNPDMDILKGKQQHFEVLESLKEEGKIRAYGVSIDTLSEFEIALDIPNIDVVEIMFNMIHQEPKFLFEKAKEKNILLIIKIPFDSGWLTGKYHLDTVFDDIRSRWSKKDISIRYALIEELKEIVTEKNMIKNALAFIKSFDAVNVIIPGIKNIEQLYSNCEAITYDLPIKDKYNIEYFYEEKIKQLNLPW
jgi:aryl-alcohol dehydrogenase-like predicted oxidoreductase